MDRNLSIGLTIAAILVLLTSGLIANNYKVPPNKLSGAEIMANLPTGHSMACEPKGGCVELQDKR